MTQEERVLVVDRAVVESAGMFQGVAFDVQHYVSRLFVPGTPRFMRRSEAEQDATFKQLIPYVIMTCDDKVLTYVRGKRAGETRLVGQRSIGIGGHINPLDDMPLFNTDFREAYLSAVEREVAEEVSVEAGHTDRVVGLINDDSNAVGQVHLGIIHHWQLDSPSVTKREQMITQIAFMTPAELQEVQDSMETWSQLCLKHIDRLTASSDSAPASGKDSDVLNIA